MIRRIRFVFERLIVRGLRYRLLLAAAVIALVALTAGLAAFALGAGFSDVGEAVWWAFLRLTDPGYLGDDEGTARRTLSTVVTVAGYVLFLGLLIAILTQWMNDVITRLESGVTPVELSDHIVILGWSHRTPIIVRDLLSARGRVQRFLAMRDAGALRIVVLAPAVDATLRQRLRERLGDLWDDRRVLVRAGTPLRLDHLERVAFRSAAVLMLPGPEFAEDDPAAVDSQTIKTLMSISQHAGDRALPLAVAELGDRRREAQVRQAYRGPIEVSVPSTIATRLLTAGLRKPGLSDVFVELLAVGRGASIHLREVPGGLGFGELQARCARAVPVGLLPPDGRPRLLPGASTHIEAGTLAIFIAHRHEDCEPESAEDAALVSRDVRTPVPPPRPRRLLILGWSRKVPGLIHALEEDADFWEAIDVASGVPIAQRSADAASLGVEPSARVRHFEVQVELPEALARLEPQSYDHILRVASERQSVEEEADATSVSIYLALQQMLPERAARPQLFFELLDEENAFLFETHRDDVLVTPRVAGYLVSQIALRRELAPVFERMGGRAGPRMRLRWLSDYDLPAEGFRFEALQRAAAERGQIAIGLRKDVGADAGVWLVPARDRRWRAEPGDAAIVLEDPAAA